MKALITWRKPIRKTTDSWMFAAFIMKCHLGGENAHSTSWLSWHMQAFMVARKWYKNWEIEEPVRIYSQIVIVTKIYFHILDVITGNGLSCSPLAQIMVYALHHNCPEAVRIDIVQLLIDDVEKDQLRSILDVIINYFLSKWVLWFLSSWFTDS